MHDISNGGTKTVAEGGAAKDVQPVLAIRHWCMCMHIPRYSLLKLWCCAIQIKARWK